MDWSQTINAYCERTDATFWSEPINAVTNAAFILAAIFVFAQRTENRKPGLLELALIGLVFIIGIGSFLFHTFATRWAGLADVLPITVFIFAYFAYALRRFVGFGRIATAIGTLLFFAVSPLAEPVFSPIVGGSASYLPGLFAMLGIGGYLLAKRHPAGPLVLGAGLVFCVSLGFRIADGPLCDIWPMGTHFLWHILNATTLGLLLMAATRSGAKPDGRERPT
ncbi:ceramidase domain-containing protein [Fulvimarina sp. MAC3]|uniref:ceramidase domain-containing protein n=1 Tax=Fulvimarina sp. MAC3 TaxID=3148887 RepID=UPI0031FBC424